ncbi:hypothetical protein HMPREF1547_01454 [Blautia sp. KLE 1732]|nr:hypothetical protein HMPREF1547_01454 [Blautia sp. KLE 1732]
MSENGYTAYFLKCNCYCLPTMFCDVFFVDKDHRWPEDFGA